MFCPSLYCTPQRGGIEQWDEDEVNSSFDIAVDHPAAKIF